MRNCPWFVTLVSLLAVSACVSTTGSDDAGYPAFQDGPACEFETVAFHADFDGGRLSACRQEDGDSYALYFRPEDTPINPSSWFAFAVETGSDEAIEITLNYVHGRHRYSPKLSVDDGESWTDIETTPLKDGEVALVTLKPTAERTLIAGQPLYGLDRYEDWMSDLDEMPGVSRQTIGQSEQGRDIEALSFGADGAPALVLIGRQHPPEIPGAIAMRAFVERLLEDDPLAVRFRGAFRVELIPLLNPDGVVLGQWRHNTRGVDLNRDWGPFTQVETRAARDWMAGFDSIAAAFDFHSTWYDVLYTQPDDAMGPRAGFTKAFSDALVERFGPIAPKRDSAHNPGAPNAKSWIHQTYQIPAITYEAGDETPLSDVILIARGAAEVTMQLLLEEAE